MRGRRDVVVTGVGVVSPVGRDRVSFFDGLLQAELPLVAMDEFPSAGFSCPFGGQVRDFDPAAYVKKRKALKLMGRNILFAIAAAAEATGTASLGAVAPERFGVTLGGRTRISDFEELEGCVLASLEGEVLSVPRYAAEGMHHVYPLSMLKNLCNMAAAHLSIEHRAQGPSNTVTDGEPSGLQAVGEAFRAIQRGDADVMLAGGTDSLVDPLDLAQNAVLGILSDDRTGATTSRPYDAAASGAMVGEGAAVLVLESREHAQGRGATILGRILGFGEGFEPSLAGAASAPVSGGAWRRALEDARLGPDALGGVVLAGSGHGPRDAAECALVRAVLGATPPPLTSGRGAQGLAGAATSALDVAAGLLASQRGVVPPVARCRELAAEAAGLPFVLGEARPAEALPRLVTAFSRAGVTAALVLDGGVA